MPSARYPLEEGGSERLEITWDTSWPGRWRNIVVRLDRHEIGTAAGRAELKAGQTFFLPDGSVLGVQLVTAPFAAGLRVVLDGQPLPGSACELTEPARLMQGIKGTAPMVFFIGAVNLALGMLAMFARSGFLQYAVWYYGISPISIVFGLALLKLAFPVQRRSIWALATVATLVAIEGVIGGYLVAQFQYPQYRDTTVGITGIVVQVIGRVMMLNIAPLSVIARGMILLRRLKRWQPSTV